MSVFLLRRKSLGKSSVAGIVNFSEKGIEAYRSDGMKQTVEGLGSAPGKYKSKYIPAAIPSEGVCIRWGCSASVPNGVKVINKAEAIHKVADKAGFRKVTADLGLAPETWLNKLDVPENSIFDGVVVRPITHAQGKHLDVCYEMADMFAACAKYGQYYISRLIEKVAEFRVFIHQGRVVWVAEKKPGNPDQVAWNVAQGGMFTNVKWGDWNLSVIKNALASYHQSGLDFGGVDVMIDAEGKPYTLEINSAPSQTSAYRQECVARAFDWSINNGWEMLNPVEDTPAKTWKSYIHPGVRQKEGK